MVIDEGQQYGTDREIAVISVLQQQPSILRGPPFVGSESTTSSAAKSDVAPTGFLVGFSVSMNPLTHQASAETCAL